MSIVNLATSVTGTASLTTAGRVGDRGELGLDGEVIGGGRVVEEESDDLVRAAAPSPPSATALLGAGGRLGRA